MLPMNQIQMMINLGQQEIRNNGGRGIPTNTLDQMYSQNQEAAKQVQDLLASGKNPRDASIEMMRRMGIDPNSLFRR